MAPSQVKVRDGTGIVYELFARAVTAPRIVLIHSLGMDRWFWTPITERLAKDASVLVYDCRGHGQSDKPKGPYTVELFADDLADLLDHVGWHSAIIAGASMGGSISLAFAAAYPQRTLALGLIDTTAWYNAPEAWEERARRALHEGLASMIEFQTKRWFTDAFRTTNPEATRRTTETFLANDPAAYAETCRMLGACNLTAALPRLKMPTVVVVGEEDYATPLAMAETMHRGIIGSTLIVLPHARHLTAIEDPGRIGSELARLTEAVPIQ
ncbi:MAG: alpha/beta fold hydrolase [Bradyrhizobiaceae bacterium]|nr:alpha/beta fold hydrolase [Bradyrhizobiaceae bacterium]